MIKFLLIIIFTMTISISCDKKLSDNERVVEHFINNDNSVVLCLDTVEPAPGEFSPIMEYVFRGTQDIQSLKLFSITQKSYPLLWQKYYSKDRPAFIAFKDSMVVYTGFTTLDVKELRSYYDSN